MVSENVQRPLHWMNMGEFLDDGFRVPLGKRRVTGLAAPPNAVAPHFSSAPRSRHPAERAGTFLKVLEKVFVQPAQAPREFIAVFFFNSVIIIVYMYIHT